MKAKTNLLLFISNIQIGGSYSVSFSSASASTSSPWFRRFIKLEVFIVVTRTITFHTRLSIKRLSNCLHQTPHAYPYWYILILGDPVPSLVQTGEGHSKGADSQHHEDHQHPKVIPGEGHFSWRET